ncbi:DUF4232 domain-containing protein [Streptomyces mangrovisoli]|uniref:DUF4232 domain-containing protein n=1 Tax=Streptomyces mangrovisoli TaxID=1428628 RepID=A0A1J4NPH2_9ACTN|nr:DUF4232 domain-containing protein [Streptomyces mangrovisoli]OIJ64042.1 hypothetical protein WN71_030820 [Streptomyces mangrovisoli]
MKLSRHHRLLLATAGTALALSLTACQSDGSATSAPAAAASASGTAADGDPTSGSGTTDPVAGQSSVASSKGSTDQAGSAAGGSADSSGEQASAATRVCTSRDVRVSAATQGGPPYTHIVLTAKNTSGHSCRLTGAPHIQFLESHKQDVPPVAKSKPAAPVVLTPGAPAYALVKLSDGGVDEDAEPVSAFSVVLEGDSAVIAVRAPGSGGIAVDPANALTGYWTPELRNGADDF